MLAPKAKVLRRVQLKQMSRPPCSEVEVEVEEVEVSRAGGAGLRGSFTTADSSYSLWLSLCFSNHESWAQEESLWPPSALQ